MSGGLLRGPGMRGLLGAAAAAALLTGLTSLPASGAVAATGQITGVGGKCVDVAGADNANGTPVQLYDCNGTAAQQWSVGARDAALVKAVLGLDRVTGGEIRVRGEPVRIASPRQALHRFGIGYLTENRKEEGVFLEQPIARNITVTVWRRLAKALGFVSAREERAVAHDLVERLGIRVAGLGQHAGELSGGNQQKVSLAKWLAADTRLLIVDEPTVGVDVRTKHAFHELIWELARDGLPILLISSDLTEMITLADRVVVMADHRIRGEVDNDRDYERMSGRIIRVIHDRATSAVRPRAVEA
ncbi:hypothetical protein GCM10009579_73830 [Streptomyces javensis]|uniref:ABC transporter domain-containing protein n=1 Tax=Streptomyces javensis TaxID=114698 RepID=A0ABN1XCK4_9ACTN